jgi:hypothetical protein
MYSEDTQEDFNTMDRQKQEALLKRTWVAREKEFYGEELDEDPDMIIEEAEDGSDSDDDYSEAFDDGIVPTQSPQQPRLPEPEPEVTLSRAEAEGQRAKLLAEIKKTPYKLHLLLPYLYHRVVA